MRLLDHPVLVQQGHLKVMRVEAKSPYALFGVLETTEVFAGRDKMWLK